MALQYEELAVEALRQVLASDQLVTELRALEADRNLPGGALPDPVAVEDAFLPFDNRSPLVQVYDEGGEMVDQIEALYAVECTVAISYTGSGERIAEDERLMRRYLSAVRNVIRSNPLLRYPTTSDAPQVVGALIQNHDRVVFGDDSTTRHHRGVAVQVRVHTP